MPSTDRGYPAGPSTLELDGAAAGTLGSANGGDAYGEVVTERPGGDPIARKRITGVHYSPLVLECGTGMSKGFYDWLSATLRSKAERHDGAVVVSDLNGQARSRLEFQQALIASIGFPALDASSKDVASLTVALQPETSRRRAASNALPKLPIDKQRRWLASAFRLSIDGLDCTKTMRVAPLVVTQRTVLDSGELRDPLPKSQ